MAGLEACVADTLEGRGRPTDGGLASYATRHACGPGKAVTFDGP